MFNAAPNPPPPLAGPPWTGFFTLIQSEQLPGPLRYFEPTRLETMPSHEPPPQQRGDGMNASYALGALVVLIALWVAAS